MKNADILFSLLLALLDRASGITALLNVARAEGRDVTDKEIEALASGDDLSRIKLQEAIAKARSA